MTVSEEPMVVRLLLAYFEHRQGLTPRRTELIPPWRRRLEAMEAAERQGLATVSSRGVMVDRAMVKTAQQMLAFAKAVGMNVGYY